MDYPRPSGYELTGHDDAFDRIELMARSSSGEIVRREFVRIGDQQRIRAFASDCNRAGFVALHSICVYAKADRAARYAVPFYLHIHCLNDLERARKCLIESGEQLAIEMDTVEESFHAYFDGNDSFDLLVPFQVFDGFYSPWIFPLYAAMAKKHASWNPGLIEQGIYSEEYACILPGSRHPHTGLYKVRLCWDEVTGLSAHQIRQLAASPRPEESYLEAGIGKYAPWWFTSELKRIEQTLTTCLKCRDGSTQHTRGLGVPPCVQAMESAVLPDAARHTTYYSLASVYAGLNVHYPEIVARLQAIDRRNPIRDSRDIEKAANHGCHHPSCPPCSSVLRRYCPKGGCELAEPKRRPTD